ncbi:MAG: hypothetical protein R3Y54_09770 [Eubacteriales bacterium]
MDNLQHTTEDVPPTITEMLEQNNTLDKKMQRTALIITIVILITFKSAQYFLF